MTEEQDRAQASKGASRPLPALAGECARPAGVAGVPSACAAWRAVLTAFAVSALLGCVPRPFTGQSQVAVAPVSDEVSEARDLVSPSPELSIRGAAADEPLQSDAWRHRAVLNALLTADLRRREGPLYRKRDPDTARDDLPQYCIALSGGGMRALAFETGVLHALRQRGLYDRVAVLSSVSGGGYASYWIAGNVKHGVAEADLLSGPDSPQLTALRMRADGLVSPGTGARFLGSIMTSLPEPPHPGLPAPNELVAQTFGLVDMQPGSGNLGYVTSLDTMLSGNLHVFPLVTAGGLRDLVAAGRMPLPVWLATARPPDAPRCVGQTPGDEVAERSRPLSYSAFEIGPIRMGSDQLGFLTHMLLPALNATAVSGAAMSVPFSDRCRDLNVVDASVIVKNYPAVVRPAAPRATGHHHRTSFELTDGGVADNLGVFPLVRRLCSDIIIVDAEFDPYLVFEGYGYLKQQLARLDIPLEVPAIENVAARNRMATAPPNADAPCVNGLCMVRPKPGCARRERGAECLVADQLPGAVFEGTLGPVPFASRAQAAAADADRWGYAERLARIHYVKLSLDASSIDQYPKTVRDRYASQRNRRQVVSSSAPCVSTRDNGACSFPHEPTANLNYSGGEFEAYWDLGRCVIERDWPEPANSGRRTSCGDSRW